MRVGSAIALCGGLAFLAFVIVYAPWFLWIPLVFLVLALG